MDNFQFGFGFGQEEAQANLFNQGQGQLQQTFKKSSEDNLRQDLSEGGERVQGQQQSKVQGQQSKKDESGDQLNDSWAGLAKAGKGEQENGDTSFVGIQESFKKEQSKETQSAASDTSFIGEGFGFGGSGGFQQNKKADDNKSQQERPSFKKKENFGFGFGEGNGSSEGHQFQQGNYNYNARQGQNSGFGGYRGGRGRGTGRGRGRGGFGNSDRGNDNFRPFNSGYTSDRGFTGDNASQSNYSASNNNPSQPQSKEKEQIVKVGQIQEIPNRFLCWPTVLIYALGKEISFTERPLYQHTNTDLLVIPFLTTKLELYGGNIINSCTVNYRKKIADKIEKGIMVCGGEPYFQKTVGNTNFKTFAFVYVDPNNVQNTFLSSLQKMFAILNVNTQVPKEKIIIPLSMQLKPFSKYFRKIIEWTEEIKGIKRVSFSMRDEGCFKACLSY